MGKLTRDENWDKNILFAIEKSVKMKISLGQYSTSTTRVASHVLRASQSCSENSVTSLSSKRATDIGKSLGNRVPNVSVLCQFVCVCVCMTPCSGGGSGSLKSLNFNTLV